MTKDQSAGADASVITGGAAEAGLPVDSLREAAPYLRRPFTPEAIKFKVQTVFGGASGCLVVAYIDARLVIERLNLVIPDKWTARYDLIDGTKLAWCTLAVDGIWRTDVGESPKGLSKDLISDALKRAAVHFGVGVSVYALPQITLNADQPHVQKKKTSKGDTLVLTDHGHSKLREGYAKWLTEKPHGFGEPLHHGDVEGATIDVDETEPDEFAPEPAPALEDDRAQKLRAALEASYDRFRAIGSGAGAKEVPAVKYRAWVDGAAHSHEEMERLLRWFEERGAELAARYGGAS